MMRETAIDVVRKLQNAGFEAYFAGGCVRDQLMGQKPKDYDVATNALPNQVRKVFQGSLGVGAHFGVMLVKQDGYTIEIATFRTDGKYKNGRRPESVTFATMEKDAQRRDFTINGMFYDPLAEKLFDYVGGKDDISSKVIQCIGDPEERFNEDHLRLLRAIRFATRLRFSLQKGTFDAIQNAAPCISCISPERIRDELDRIWSDPNRLRGFDLLVKSGLMAEILPEILELQGCEQPPQWHPEGDVFVHTRMMLALLEPTASLPLVLSVLFHDIAKPATQTFDEADGRIRFNGHDQVGAEMTEGILRRLRYSNEVIQATCKSVANHMKFKDVRKMRKSKLKRFMATKDFTNELELHRIDCLCSNGLLDNYTYLQEQLITSKEAPIIPPRLVTGSDLIALGWSPGPLIGKMLTEIQTQQLEGNLTTKEDGLAWAKKLYPIGKST